MRKLVALAVLAALMLPAGGATALLPQDDAGSGTDAPGVPTPSFRIDPGVVYDGHIEGKTGGDSTDWYAFSAPAGAPLDVRATGAVGCLYLHDAAGAELTSVCSAAYFEIITANAVTAEAGTYYVEYEHNNAVGDTVPQAYRFSVGVGAPAPSPVAPATIDDVLPPEAPRGVAPVLPASQSDEHVVIAVVDTGINPYHDFFAAPALADHPSTWLNGFPATAESVDLSLDEPSFAAARAADSAAWAGLSRSTYDAASDTFDAHLYTFPGTRVVGAVSFGEYVDPLDPTAPPPVTPVLDENGHGTHSAGLALGAHLGAADGNVLVVAVEGSFNDGVRWAARQPWIDAISASVGTPANHPGVYTPDDRTRSDWATREAHQAGKPVFLASGNGFSNSAVTPDHCTTYTSPWTGPAWVTRVGSAEPRTGNPTHWHCVPVDAIARTNVDSPRHDDLTAISAAGGTSAATPNLAGHFAHLLLTARRNGSPASRFDVRDYLLHSARPAEPRPYLGNEPSVYPLSLADQGYGLVDQAALDAATTRLLARSGPQPRPETEWWFEKDAQIRTALWGPGSATDGSWMREVTDPPQDDAGTGADAPDDHAGDVPRIEPGVRYAGQLTLPSADGSDWYAFEGTAGDVVTLAGSAAFACYELVSPSNVSVTTGCTAGYAAELPADVATLAESGTWYLGFGGVVPQTYSFAFGVNGQPPPVFP